MLVIGKTISNIFTTLVEFAYIELPHDMVMAFWSTFLFSSTEPHIVCFIDQRYKLMLGIGKTILNISTTLVKFAYIELPHDMVMAFWSTFFFSSTQYPLRR